jgi:hypothetical protein
VGDEDEIGEESGHVVTLTLSVCRQPELCPLGRCAPSG